MILEASASEYDFVWSTLAIACFLFLLTFAIELKFWSSNGIDRIAPSFCYKLFFDFRFTTFEKLFLI